MKPIPDLDWKTGLPLTFGERSRRKETALVRASVRIALFRKRKTNLECLFVTHPVKGFEVPGGAVDPDEVPLTSALRELAEEAGIELNPTVTPVHLAGFVPITDQQNGRWLDITFAAALSEDDLLTNSRASAEFPVTWINIADFGKHLSNNAQLIANCALHFIQNRT